MKPRLALEMDENSVVVLQGTGPKGYPGCQKWHARSGKHGMAKKLLQPGITDLVQVSDARMSAAASGTVVLQVAPESTAGGRWRGEKQR